MVSRVPYPSFKGLDLHRNAQIELMFGVVVVAAMLFAMPQFTFCMLALAYVASGPFLLARGEHIAAPPVLTPVGDDVQAETLDNSWERDTVE